MLCASAHQMCLGCVLYTKITEIHHFPVLIELVRSRVVKGSRCLMLCSGSLLRPRQRGPDAQIPRQGGVELSLAT